MIYFHLCQNFINKSNREVDSFVKKFIIENKNRKSVKGLGKVTPFNGGIYIINFKKPYYGNIVLQEKHLEFEKKEHTVYFIRSFFKENLQEFVEVRSGRWLNYNPLEEYELLAFKEVLKNKKDNTVSLEKPPNDLIDWQKNYELKVDYNIYETENWVKFALDNSIDSGMKLDEVKVFRLALLEIINENSTSIEILKKEQNYQTISSVFNEEIGVIYNKINVEGKTIFQLIDGANIKSQKENWNIIKSNNYNFNNQLNTINDISRMSVKAYPNWSLNNADLWAKVQKNGQYGNLSLLPEQTNFLKNFKFPKYINGQAGSGKSTMLYYLFSNIYYYKFINEIKGDIVFLTENEKLLEHTQGSVVDLLYNNPEFDMSSEPEAIADADNHFHPFKEFLLSFLPDGCSEFDSNKYLNFSKFKLLYEESNIPEHIISNFSAELVWFTLTTYVKGNSLDYNITSDNYEDKMPKKGKELISKEDLKKMEKVVINPFYNKLMEEGYWDKIKLIQYLNENVEIDKKFEVIFCDEAQDFSKVELRFIIQLSSYNDFDLSDVEQFPIVFAGDAHQTVNPTGFRSEVLTSMIYEELSDKENNYNLDSSKLEFTPQFNYRSSQTIVNLSNAIQFHRKEKLNADIKNPQISKRPLLNRFEHLNVFVSFDTFKENQVLQNKIGYKTIIVPVNNEEITEYKKKNKILEKYNNIISAVDAKGLDFNEVALYGFGEHRIFNKNIGTYEKRFFFNKLYVAITRAQAELVIIDSEKSKSEFWEPIVENYLKSKWCRDTSPKLSEFEDLIIFDSNEVILSSENVLENDAIRQKEHGILEKNIPLLSIAANHFLKLRNQKEYYLCLGTIEEIKENWGKASEFYSKKITGDLGYFNAMNVLWLGKLFEDFLNLNEKNLYNSNSNDIHVKIIISKLFRDGELSFSDLKILSEKSNVLRRVITIISWRKDVINEFISFLNSTSDDDEILILCDLLEEICSKNNEGDALLKVSDKYYSLGKYQNVISLLESLSIEDKTYYKSKLQLAKRKENIEEIIIYSGHLAIQSKNPKKYISCILENYSLKSNKGLNINNIYYDLYGYLAHIYSQSQHSKIIELSKKVEKSFDDSKRNIALANAYYFLLSRGTNNSTFNFCLERWVKSLSKEGVSIKKINNLYKSLITSLNNDKLEYIAFTKKEIDLIKTIPTEIKRKTPNHFENLDIINFRKFKNLEIRNLGLVNLVVGDNNIGKTSFLESLLFTNDKKTLIKRLAYAYIDRANISPEKHTTSDGVNLFYSLNKTFLKEYINCNSKDDIISYKIYDKRETWNFNLNFFNEINNNDSLLLNFEKLDFNILKNLSYEDGISLPYMPFGKGFGLELASVYDSKIRPDRDLEKHFLNHLKTFIPKIKQIFINSEGNIDIRDDEYSEDRPLSQYGDGANKLFRILLLLTIHKGKTLLIDEIDAGIHYTRFKEFWRILLRISKVDNTQLVVTTHNEECIKYFNDVLNEQEFGENYQKISRVVQMKKVNELKIRSFEYESFNLAMEDSFELR